MPECPPECTIASIPARLHTSVKNDGKVDVRLVQRVDDSDRLFMRHPPLPDGGGYGFKIPEHDHLADQSVNSEVINVPNGCVRDVLFDTKHGNHYFSYQIACLAVSEIRTLEVANNNTIEKDRLGNVVRPADIYTFDVRHVPAQCMYPHCIIHAMKNDKPIENKHVRDVMKTVLRSEFAKLAERRRLEIARIVALEMEQTSS